MRTASAALVLALAVAGCSSTSAPPPATAGSPTATPAEPVTTDWPGYHGAADRRGVAAGPVTHGGLRVAWSLPVDGALYAQPIVAAGRVIAATENNTLYAADAATGRLVWRTHLAPPARRSELPCGNIDPSGITGTPAYDAATHLVLVVTESTGAHHTLVAVDATTGRVRWRRDLDVIAGRDRLAEQERGALLVAHGRVYVPFGGRYGDCGNYVGYVAAVALDGRGPVVHYAVATQREAGMWAAPGPVLGPGGGIYVAVGNGAEVGGRYDGSDSVLRLTPTLQRIALFAPSTWPQDNAQDLDLGSMSPAVVGQRLVIAGKRGVVYLLNATLGGVGGQVATLDGCAGYGGAAVHDDIVVMPCNGGVRTLRVSGATMRWLWQRRDLRGSPVVVNDAVLGFDNGDLVAVSLAGGHRIASVHVGDVSRFATPAPAGGRIFVGTTTHLVAVTPR